jgi:hypothetical protein
MITSDASNRQREITAMIRFGSFFDRMDRDDRYAVAYINYELWPNTREGADQDLLRERRKQILDRYIILDPPEGE